MQVVRSAAVTDDVSRVFSHVARVPRHIADRGGDARRRRAGGHDGGDGPLVTESPSDLHPALAALAPLLGSWVGSGDGEYPTIPSFGYLEEVTFGHVGKPFLSYGQRTRASDDGRPLHAETGYLRVPSPGRVEMVLAHPTGITEIQEGSLTVTGAVLELELNAMSIGLTASAKDVTALSRSIRIDGDELVYTLRMAAVGQPLRHHLAATLHRKQE